MKWQTDFKSPVVAMYSLEADGLHKLPFLILSNESLDYVRRGLTSLSELQQSDYLSRLLYVSSIARVDYTVVDYNVFRM